MTASRNVEVFSLIGYAESGPEKPNIIRRPYGLEPWMLELTVDGEGIVQPPDGGAVSFVKGDIFCYRPRIPQYYEFQRDAGKWCHYWICFYPSEACLKLLDWEEKFEGFLTAKVSENILNRMENVFKEAIAVSRSHYPLRYEMMNNMLEQMLLWVKMENAGTSSMALDERIRESLYFIDDSIHKPIRVEQLARTAGLSVSRYAHLFQDTMGMSPLRYVERRRMERAIEYLLGTTGTISQIAQNVGYDDPLYFSRVFRRTVGASPKNYRTGARILAKKTF